MKRLNLVKCGNFGVRFSSKGKFSGFSIDETLDALCTSLPIKNWILTGGLAMDLIYQRPIKPRADIDIRVPLDTLLETVNYSTGTEEYIFSIEHFRLPFLFYADLVEFPKRIGLDQIQGKHLAFNSRAYLAGKKKSIVDLIDVYSSVDGIELKYGFNLRGVENDTFEYITPNGSKVLVSGPRYMERIKSLLNRRKDQQELRLLRASSQTP